MRSHSSKANRWWAAALAGGALAGSSLAIDPLPPHLENAPPEKKLEYLNREAERSLQLRQQMAVQRYQERVENKQSIISAMQGQVAERSAEMNQEETKVGTGIFPPAEPLVPEGHREPLGIGTMLALMSVLAGRVLLRHRRDAELRRLSGKYLSDGTELADWAMPAWFAPDPSYPQLRSDWVGGDEGKLAERSPMEVFLEEVPTLLGNILQAVRELARVAPTADLAPLLQGLATRVKELKERANFWEVRPVWQMTSALELLVLRLVDKPKDGTPSTLRTITAATDLLKELCVAGIRPNLIIEPPIRVLAADDDALCLRAMVFALQKAGFAHDVVEDGAKASEMAAQHPYDVIFLDIQMPGMDGMMAATKIRETAQNRETPVVFVTVQSDFHTRAQSQLIGGCDLMAKPYLVFELTVKALMLAIRRRLLMLPSAAAAAAVPGLPTVAEKSAAPALDRAAILARLAQVRVTAPALAEEPPEPITPSRVEPREVTPAQPEHLEEDFSVRVPDLLVEMGCLLESVCDAEGEAARQECVGDLYLRVHAFANQAELAGLSLAAKLSSRLEAMLKKIYEKPKTATDSTLNTVAHALALLQELCSPEVESKLGGHLAARMLVVDDEPLARRALAGALQLAFDKPDQAENGAQALAMARQAPYEVIFTDVQMPELDGFGFCSQLRGTAEHQDTPVIFVTSLNDTAAREKARVSGGTDFLAKPCLPSEVTLKAMTFILRKRLVQMHARQMEAMSGARPVGETLAVGS